MMYRTVACHGETASPGVGRAVYPTILEVSFICLLGVAVIGKIGRHVRLLKKSKNQKKNMASCSQMARLADMKPGHLFFFFVWRKKPYMSIPSKPLGLLDTQHDPLRGKLFLHGKRRVRYIMTT